MTTKDQKRNLSKLLYIIYSSTLLLFSALTLACFNPKSEYVESLFVYPIFLGILSSIAILINIFTTKIPLFITYTILVIYLTTAIIFSYGATIYIIY